MDAFFVSCPVLFRMEYFYYTVAALPIVIAIVCVILYAVYRPDHKSDSWPTYAEIVSTLPQLRVYSIGMNFEAIFLLFFGLIRDHILVYVLEKSERSNQILSNVLLQISRFSVVVACFSLMILAHSPSGNPVLSDYTNPFFFVSALIYFLVGDFLTWKSNSRLTIISCVVTASAVLASVLFALLRYVGKKMNASTVFSYIALVALFVKLCLAKKEMVSHGIRITRRLIYNSDDRPE
jgi:hypothetical protein